MPGSFASMSRNPCAVISKQLVSPTACAAALRTPPEINDCSPKEAPADSKASCTLRTRSMIFTCPVCMT